MASDYKIQHCPKCGAVLDEDAAFCLACTNQIFRSESEAVIGSNRPKIIALFAFLLIGGPGGIYGGSALLIAMFDRQSKNPAFLWLTGFGGVIAFFVTLWFLLRTFKTI